jgi:hypothetical protein
MEVEHTNAVPLLADKLLSKCDLGLISLVSDLDEIFILPIRTLLLLIHLCGEQILLASLCCCLFSLLKLQKVRFRPERVVN